LVPLPEKGDGDEASSTLGFGLFGVSCPRFFRILGLSSFKSVDKYSVEPSVNPESFSSNPEGKRFRSGRKESQGFGSKTAMAFQTCIPLIQVRLEA
jgi:hypothetical protein